MLGIGGVLAEAVADVAFRLVPIDADRRPRDDRLARGPGAARTVPRRARRRPRALAATLVALSELAEQDPSSCRSTSTRSSSPAASRSRSTRWSSWPTARTRDRPASRARRRTPSTARLRGALRARGASSWSRCVEPPGQVRLRRAAQHPQPGLRTARSTAPTSRAARCSASRCVTSLDDLPRRRRRRPRRSCARPPPRTPSCSGPAPRRGISRRVRHLRRIRRGRRARAAPAERELVALADELGILLAGPNGQGVVSTPGRGCARRSSPRSRRAGRIAIASQSGNFVSSFQNLAVRAASASAGRSPPATLRRSPSPTTSSTSPRTPRRRSPSRTSKGIGDGRDFFERARAVTEPCNRSCCSRAARPRAAQRAAASHTGALASDDRVFDGMCRQAGITRTATVDEAFDAAATFATQPLPRGPRVAVLTTAGGWGVVTADAITRSELELARPARRPARRDRREAAAAVEPQQPDRPRRRRDPRHHPRGARARRRAIRTSTR